MERQFNLLLVEDDLHLALVYKKWISKWGYNVIHFTCAEKTIRAFNSNSYRSRNQIDLCVIDIKLPGKDGFYLATQIRKLSDIVPIIFISGKKDEVDTLHGFQIGGDEFFKKPFNIEILRFRLEVLLKHSKESKAQETYRIGKLNFMYHDAYLIDNTTKKIIQLTRKEAQLLRFFCENSNKAIKREEILFHVWGKDDYYLGRSMDVFIANLRKALAIEEDVRLLTIHGVGFRFVNNSTKVSYK